jgi:hypothetical protein
MNAVRRVFLSLFISIFAASMVTLASPESPMVSDTKPLGTNSAEVFCKLLAESPRDQALLSKLKTIIVSMKQNTDEKCRYAVIYYLGCLTSGQEKEAESVRQYLRQNFASNSYVDYISAAHIGSPCPNCDGGFTEVPCAKCGATGTCPDCNGDGIRRRPGLNGTTIESKCFSCGGFGKCKECGGSGKVKHTCSTCKGSGSRISEKKAERIYLSLLGVSATDRKSDEGKEDQQILHAPNDGDFDTREADAAAAEERRKEAEINLAALKLRSKQEADAKQIIQRLDARYGESTLLTRHGVRPGEMNKLSDESLTTLQQDMFRQELWNKGFALHNNTIFRLLFLPFPNGFQYKVRDVLRQCYSQLIMVNPNAEGYRLSLQATKPIDDEMNRILGADLGKFNDFNSLELAIPLSANDILQMKINDKILSQNWVISIPFLNPKFMQNVEGGINIRGYDTMPKVYLFRSDKEFYTLVGQEGEVDK